MGLQHRERRREVVANVQLDELPAELVAQPLGVIEGDDAALVHDRDPVAEPLRLVEVVRGKQDRQVGAGAEASWARRRPPPLWRATGGWRSWPTPSASDSWGRGAGGGAGSTRQSRAC